MTHSERYAVQWFVGPKRGSWITGTVRWNSRGSAQHHCDEMIAKEEKYGLTPLLRRVIQIGAAK